mmetsp:Transcript_56847/g.94302  ORF Transcript_56847/g.94302 Transcript_56847/m.94302 type:complete len:139 (-) Transcript_56847:20-436(-)
MIQHCCLLQCLYWYGVACDIPIPSPLPGYSTTVQLRFAPCPPPPPPCFGVDSWATLQILLLLVQHCLTQSEGSDRFFHLDDHNRVSAFLCNRGQYYHGTASHAAFPSCPLLADLPAYFSTVASVHNAAYDLVKTHFAM